MAEIMYWEALRRAHDEEMARDPLVICMGEDIGVAGGTYKATKGLWDKYGPERVIDTPISENSFTGIGIGAEELKRLFKAFEQVDSSAARRFGGTGLGLAMVYSIVQGHGGLVEVDSRQGEGTSFHLYLPLTEGEARAPVAAAGRRPGSARFRRTGGSAGATLAAKS